MTTFLARSHFFVILDKFYIVKQGTATTGRSFGIECGLFDVSKFCQKLKNTLHKG